LCCDKEEDSLACAWVLALVDVTDVVDNDGQLRKPNKM
jgi:hypothetical protein